MMIGSKDLYTDGVRPFFAGVLRRIQAYDPRLFVRWNRTRGHFELWRWRDAVPIPSRLVPSEIPGKAVVQFQVDPKDFDHRVFRMLWLGDVARVSPTLSGEEVHRQMLREERDEDARNDKQATAMIEDLCNDNKRQIRREMSDMFSGYYPPEG